MHGQPCRYSHKQAEPYLSSDVRGKRFAVERDTVVRRENTIGVDDLYITPKSKHNGVVPKHVSNHITVAASSSPIQCGQT